MSRGKALSASKVDYYTRLALERGGIVTGHGPVEPPPPEPVDDEADEKAFQKRVTDEADENGWDWFHVNVAKRSKSGWPDLVLFHTVRRLILYRELKTETGRLTASQERFRDIIRAAGGDWALWRPSDWDGILATLRGTT
jgi:hypothetical protein